MQTDLEKIANKLRKKYGSLRISGDKTEKSYISTGNLSLDLALEGGIAWGYATEFSGGSGSGKTTILQKMLANAQEKYDAIGIWLDREMAFSDDRALDLGIDLDRTITIKPQDMPTMVEATEILLDTLSTIPKDTYKFIAIDSISAFADPSKIDKMDMGKKAMSIHRLFRKVLPLVDNKTSLNFSNHRTFRVGVLFGEKTTVTGGEAPKFYTSYRIKLDDRKRIVDPAKNNEIIGSWLKATVIKTRSGPNFRTVFFPHFYSTGIPYYGGFSRLLVDRNYLQPKNAKEFNAFKQSTVIYKNSKFNENDIESKLEEYPELKFDTYPDWNEIENEEGEEKSDEEI